MRLFSNIILTTALYMFCCISQAATPKSFERKDTKSRTNTVKFETYSWDFGTIYSSKGAVSHTFTLKNESPIPVKISRQVGSCECIQAHYT